MFELITLIILVFVAFVWTMHTANQEEVKRDKEKNIISKVKLQHINGIAGLPQNVVCQITVSDKQLLIDDKHAIKLSNLKSIQIIKSKELLEKETSMLGRALVGGVLLGGVGAVLGGMTALQNGKETKDVDLLIIDYKNVKNEDAQLVFMAVDKLDKNTAKSFSDSVSELIGCMSSPIINYPVEL